MKKKLIKRIRNKQAVIGVIGLGYVGLPLALAFCKRGFNVFGFDVDKAKCESLHAGKSYLSHIESSSFEAFIENKKLIPTVDFSYLAACDAIIICVPTPLTENREPDLSYVIQTAEVVGAYLNTDAKIISLESTTYPGTTHGILKETLETASGRIVGRDYFLAYSPEREDPGNPYYNVANIPKVVGGYTEDCREVGETLYAMVVDNVVPVSSAQTAEMVKIFENTYRAVNISLVNELKMLCHKMDINVFEVIQAAATKPFGFQAFYPSAGYGGHCIVIDPYYLSWRAKQFDMETKFIELAGEINNRMPNYVIQRTQDALNVYKKSLNGSKILLLGVAYKPDVNDTRESPALKIIDMLQKKGATVLYHDPYVSKLPFTRKFKFSMESHELSDELLKWSDCVLIVTKHTDIDYENIARYATLIVDTQNIIKNRDRVYQA